MPYPRDIVAYVLNAKYPVCIHVNLSRVTAQVVT